MDVNPYQPPSAEPPSPAPPNAHSRRVYLVRHPESWGRTLADAGTPLLILAVTYFAWFAAGVGALAVGCVAFATFAQSCVVWRTNLERRYLTIAIGAALILLLALLLAVPWPITAAYLALGCGLSLARALFPTRAELNLIGLKLLEDGKLEAAHACFDRVLRRDGRYYDSLVNRGVTRERLNRLDEALADLNAAIDVRVDLGLGYAHRGRIQAQRRAWNEAIADLRKGLEQDPENMDLHYWLGLSYLEQRDFAAAANEAQQIVHSVHSRAHGLFLLALVAERTGDHVAAMSHYEGTVAADANFAVAWHQLGILSAASPNPAARNGPRAVHAATRACELSHWQEWKALSVLAAAFAETAQFDQASRWAKESLRLAPPEEKATREARLAQYERGEPYRLPQIASANHG